MIPRATIDFETRSACPIKKTGSWRYSVDPTTEVLCLAFRLPHWDPGDVALWHPAFPALEMPEVDDRLEELFLWICDGYLVEAHNAWFERGIWRNQMAAKYGWPTIEADQWRCSAAKCAAHALPRNLEDAGLALGLSIRKDTAGHKLMLKLSKPRKPRKKERETWAKDHPDGAPHPIVYWERKDWFENLFAYCKTDVLAEDAVSHALPDLSPRELSVYLTDQCVNERGFCLDSGAIAAAHDLLSREQIRLNAQLTALTGGTVTKATQRKKLTDWCASRGVYLPDTTGDTIEGILAGALPADVGEALGILSQLGKSSTAKYEAMQHWLCPDGRAHGGLLYHAASTGRWGGQGVQPQNFPRGTIDDFDMDNAWTFLKTRDVEFLQVIYGSVMAALSQALRGAIIAAPGKRLYVADYASIEARVLLWLAEDDDALEVFRQNQDIYCDMASSIYGRPVTKKDKDERQMGKQAILGLGYQMGWSKFVATCETVGIHIEDEFSQQVVSAYREKYWRVKNLWEEQESRAIQAVRYGQDYEIPTGRVAWSMDGRFLYCTLPSGRRLAYCDPEIRRAFTPWGDRRDQLTFMAPDPITKQWRRQHTYGGMLVENITQAVARDLMADALLRCEQSGVFQPVLTVHDELIAEGDPGLDIHAFERLMTEGSEWAAGCPIKAEGFVCDRYRK